MEGKLKIFDACFKTLRGRLKALLVIFIFFIVLGSLMPARAATAADTVALSEAARLYRSVKINYGDSLSSIAAAYNNCSGIDDEEYISEIKKINSLTSDNIHPGCYITVVYSK